jgi:ribonuclease BN (tRNA processing enzyme)
MERAATLIPLGMNGFFPSYGRETMSFLLIDGERFLLLDAGSGVGRLVAPELRECLKGADRFEVVLTHYHLDHLVGLPSLHRLAQGKPLMLHVPASPLVDASPDSLEKLIAPPFFPVPLTSWTHPVEVAPFHSSPLFASGFRLEVRRQLHPGGSVGVRVGDLLAYLTDTAWDEGLAEFVKGVSWLLIEAWSLEARSTQEELKRSGHLSARQAGRVAQEAQVQDLALVHHPPWAERELLEQLRLEAQEMTQARVWLLEEGQPVKLTS